MALAVGVLPIATTSAASAVPHPSSNSRVVEANAQAASAPGDEVERIGAPVALGPDRGPGAVDGGNTIVVGRGPSPADLPSETPTRARTAAAVPGCTLAEFSALSPQALADFLTRADIGPDCLRGFLWTYTPDLGRVLTPAHVQAVLDRITALAPAYDGTNASHLYELWYFAHAAMYLDWDNAAINLRIPSVVAAINRAADAFRAGPHAFDITPTSGALLREVLITADVDGVRERQLPLLTRVFRDMDGTTNAWQSPNRAKAAIDAQVIAYHGISNGDAGFIAAVQADPAYRAGLKAFVGYRHLNTPTTSGLLRNAVYEYGRLGRIPALTTETVAGLGTLLTDTEGWYGRFSVPWSEVAHWLETYGRCHEVGVCRADVEATVFPQTYSFDQGAIEVHTSLDRATVEQLYYASKQVKEQFFRTLGTDQPLPGDPNDKLTIRLYASMADYHKYQTFLYGYATNNGGLYIEEGATFYTYQRVVPRDSLLQLEELFRHEYTHYLNGRYAVPGSFGQGPWYAENRTTAFDEGMAEYMAGATRDQGVKLRKSLVTKVISDVQKYGSRPSVRETLHFRYDDDGYFFRYYAYAGSFFSMLGRDHPDLLAEMYDHLRTNDVAGYDAFLDRVSGPTYQAEFDTYLDRQIADVNNLIVPVATYTPTAQLSATGAAYVRQVFTQATGITPTSCTAAYDAHPRFTCTGQITANIGSTDPGRMHKDMAATVDYFILTRAGAAMNNLADMNCHFGRPQPWNTGLAATSSYSCEGPLRP
ncbi:collagenase [Embleya sp. NBC_00896]|uniref:collagenase n=1 Tax=Embleya sp. NBC_00896 TaxID=2975961 RepID=UPI00386A1603|nr:collagenase [Embleya sp. NBC_00896]